MKSKIVIIIISQHLDNYVIWCLFDVRNLLGISVVHAFVDLVRCILVSPGRNSAIISSGSMGVEVVPKRTTD